MLDIELDRMPTFEDFVDALKNYPSRIGVRVEIRLANTAQTFVSELCVFSLKQEWNDDLGRSVLCIYGALKLPINGKYDQCTLYEHPLRPGFGLGLLYTAEEEEEDDE